LLRESFVKNLVVDAAFRGRGLGGSLLTSALEEFARRGSAWVDLETEADNATAQSLYRQLGFVIVEQFEA
jgi:ribosomal protein S18 acetylase RimI-like enzyme